MLETVCLKIFSGILFLFLKKVHEAANIFHLYEVVNLYIECKKCEILTLFDTINYINKRFPMK
jgi:hypothetical protein